MGDIRIAVIGVGNCASALIQGIHLYRNRSSKDPVGLMHPKIGPYAPGDIEVVLAFDIDRRKVGCDLSQAIFTDPNCTKVFFPDVPKKVRQTGYGPGNRRCAGRTLGVLLQTPPG